MFDMLVNHFQAARTFRTLYDAFEIKLIGDAYMAAFRTADALCNSHWSSEKRLAILELESE
jgi:hypothetical protein